MSRSNFLAEPGKFVQRDAKGNEYAFHGVYHAIIPAKLLVYTFEFEGTPGHVLLETVNFSENGGKTMVTDHVVYQSVEVRDGMLHSGMEVGSNESMERLEELLAR